MTQLLIPPAHRVRPQWSHLSKRIFDDGLINSMAVALATLLPALRGEQSARNASLLKSFFDLSSASHVFKLVFEHYPYSMK